MMAMQGVLTETTAELAASLTLAAARRIVEADQFMRAGLYEGWLPHLSVSIITVLPLFQITSHSKNLGEPKFFKFYQIYMTR